MNMRTAMISSTALDLPQHRKEAIEACLREDIFPIAMEYLPARDADAIRVSLEMVDRADIYIGVYAWRYGHIPSGHDISITEMEFNRAVDRKIPILVFLIHKDHLITVEMVEADNAAQEKLKNLKERASRVRGRLLFQSPIELRAHIIQSLSALLKEQVQVGEVKQLPSFHPSNVIPVAPEPYIAHPYLLLQTSRVIGRQPQLNLLTDWVTIHTQVPPDVRLLTIVAIGGMGKSALTWKWFNDIAPKELPKLAGRIWWSFYESDAHYDNFVIRSLAYTARIPEAEVRRMDAPAREDALLHLLDSQPFLLVLDGLERILLAYSRMDAAHLPDDDLDEMTANPIPTNVAVPTGNPLTQVSDRTVDPSTQGALSPKSSLPISRDSYVEKHHLRQCSDPRAGRFLRRLAHVKASRVLISTRLFPAELQTEAAQASPGCFEVLLPDLSDDDALNVWRAFGVSGTREQLLPLFNAFGNYPLLLRALAGEVADFRPAPGNFDEWRAANPDFNPAGLSFKNAKTHVLEFALRGLGETQRDLLHTIAAFRMPATWETLRSLHVGEKKICSDDQGLDVVLREIEDRGLVGWDRQSNRYDMHPIVRNIVWSALNESSRKGVLYKLRAYFDAAPKIEDWHQIDKIEDITAALELYNALIGLGQLEKAYEVFFERLDLVTDYRFCASRLRIELLGPLIIDLGKARVDDPVNLLSALHALGRAWFFAGEPRQAAAYLKDSISLSEHSHVLAGPYPDCLADLSGAFRVSGRLFEAQAAAIKAIAWLRRNDHNFREGNSCVSLGLVLAARGRKEESRVSLQRALRIAKLRGHGQFERFVSVAKAQRHLWYSEVNAALEDINVASRLAQRYAYERDFIRTARLHGSAALELGDVVTATERLHHALERARKVNFVEEELRSLIALAELRRRNTEFLGARELLDQTWSPAERGPYPLFHADAKNSLARIERDEGHHEAAIVCATRAYKLAWCDGPPYAYDYGLTQAKELLSELGAPAPQLPPFDKSGFEPMPEMELNPKDNFWVDPATLDSKL